MSETRAQDIIEKFQDWMEREDLTQKRAAAVLRVSEGTLSAVLNDSYKGRRDRVAERMLKVLRRDAQRQQRPEKPDVVATHITEQVLDVLTTAHVERSLVCVLGPTGIGKTVGARKYMEIEPGTIFLVGGPGSSPTATLKDLAVAADVEAPPKKCPARECRQSVIQGMADSDRLVVIDEVDYLSEETLQSLRIVQEEAHIGMAMIGTNDFLQKLQRRRTTTSDQFLGRVSRTAYLGRCSKEDLAQIASGYNLSEEALEALAQGAQGEARRAVHALLQVQRMGEMYTPDRIRRAYKGQLPRIQE